ncbi:MAG: N,N-dimethylformamidase beta subunit family domain-containing protein, partial [Nocardioides sp.]
MACENTKPGNPESEWGVSGSGSASIQGFATDISVDQGQTVAFKVDTTASSYRLDIYRMGFYGGSGARKITTVQPTDVRNQPNCLTQSTTGLVDCGNWTQSASWNVPSDAVSGIYFAKLVRTDSTAGSSHVFFVVRDDDGGSGMLFQTSDTTWQAYNQYGGNSLYTGSPAGRAYKVSYNRPFTTRANSPEDWVFNSEYPMVRWLESNGYDVSYTTGVDTDRRGAELLEHDVFLSVGHDEYWSGQQRANVEAARAAGVHLAFFSGNEIFWKTRWENSIDASGAPYRTLVSYKETHADAIIDPTSAWTGTWRDPRFSPPKDGGRPENALSGQIFMVNCCDTDMVVGSADGKMRFWRNTRVANLAAGATTTVGSNVIGYEWDEDLDNGSRPAGAFRVSQTASSGEVLQDYGSTYANGAATHSMTMYRAPSGALVFGAGTIQWPWALDSNHDRGSAAPDAAAQQATVNLLADMGQQPATLRTGLTTATASSDTTAPASTITAPANNATVPAGSLTVTGTATDTGGGRVGGVEVSTDDGTTWHRANGRDSWSYTFTPSSGTYKIRSRATDDSANIEAPGAGITVTVGSGSSGTCPCTIWPSTATPAATDPDTNSVELGVKFRASSDGLITGIRYYKPSAATGTHVGTLWTGTGTKLATASFTNETASGWQEAGFASPVAIKTGTTYVASYFAPSRYAVSSGYFASAATVNGPLTALRDGTDGGNGVYRYGSAAGSFPNSTYNSENYWVDVVFTTAADNTKPTVTDRTPAANATNVGVGVAPTATFSEAVQQSTISFELRNPANTLIAATTSYDSATRTATLTPNAALTASTTYTARVSGATDASGNAMDPVSWTFTTAAADTTKPTITSRVPAPGATGVSSGTKVSAVFDEPVQQSTISFELRNPSNTLVAGSTAYDSATRTATLTPSAALAASTTYTARVSGATDPSGNVMDPVSWSFTTGASANNCPCSIWPATATPDRTDPDRDPVEVGVRFRSNTNGMVTGIRFYKPVESTGTHVGSLWSNTGTRLGSVTFTNESASGWQQASFASPIPVTANTTYVASYFTPSRYAVSSSYFTTATTRGPLTALQDGTDGANGVYRYTSTAGAFPNQTFRSENYWVDVVFEDTDTAKPTVTDRTPAANATNVGVGVAPTATFNEAVQQSSITFELRDPSVNPVPATVSYAAATRTAKLTPTTPLAASTTYTARVAGATDAAGNVMDPVTWTFTTGVADNTKPTLTSRSPAPNATNVSLGSTVTAVFDESVQQSTISFELRNPSANLVASTFGYDSATRTATLTPSSPLTASTTYTARVAGAADTSGNVMDPVTWTFTTGASSLNCPCTIWPSTATPAATDADTTSVELGVKFRS